MKTLKKIKCFWVYAFWLLLTLFWACIAIAALYGAIDILLKSSAGLLFSLLVGGLAATVAALASWVKMTSLPGRQEHAEQHEA